jgi:hypothetical protein
VYTQVCPEWFSTEVTAATARNSSAGYLVKVHSKWTADKTATRQRRIDLEVSCLGAHKREGTSRSMHRSRLCASRQNSHLAVLTRFNGFEYVSPHFSRGRL